jgi:MFS family permease
MNVDLVLLSASLLTWGFGEGMFTYFQPIYLQQLGADTMTIAAVFSFFALAMMLAHIPAGYLADKIGRKPLLVAAWVAGVAAGWIMALARTLPVFVAGMLFYGFTAFVSAPMNSYVTSARGRLSPVRAMTLVSAAYNLGAVFGPISGGWIAHRYGLQMIYISAACIFIPSTVMLLFLRPQPPEVHNPQEPPASLWRNQRLMSFLVIVLLAMFVMYLPQPLTPRFLQNERGLSLERIGLLGTVGMLGNSLAALGVGQLAASSGFLLVQVAVAAFSLLLWKGTGLPWYMAGYFLLGGFRSARSIIYAQIRPLIHPAQMGLAYGIAETFSAFGVVLAPLLAGVLYTRDPALVYPVSIGLIGMVAIISGIFAPREKAKEAVTTVSAPPEL